MLVVVHGQENEEGNLHFCLLSMDGSCDEVDWLGLSVRNEREKAGRSESKTMSFLFAKRVNIYQRMKDA